VGPSQTFLTVDNFVKMVGKEVKGQDGCRVKVLEVTMPGNGQLQVRMDFEPPANAGIQLDGLFGLGGFGGFGGLGGFGGFGNTGFSLVDDKDKTLQALHFHEVGHRKGNTITVEQIVTFHLEKGQEPVKLMYSIAKTAKLEIPFTLKDVTLP
jgi:hypothetical protein